MKFSWKNIENWRSWKMRLFFLLHLIENKQPVHMRYHLFLHYEWFLQNLGKDFIRTNMQTTVVPAFYFRWAKRFCEIQRWLKFFDSTKLGQGRKMWKEEILKNSFLFKALLLMKFYTDKITFYETTLWSHSKLSHFL